MTQERHPLTNPSFEGSNGDGAWHRKTHSGQEYGNIFVPEGWTFFFRRGDEVPWDPTNDKGFRQPEAKVIPYKPPFVDPPRVAHGEWGFMFFGFYGVVEGGLYQTVPTQPHDLVRVSASVHAWTSQDDDPRTSSTAAGDQARFWLGAQQGGDPDPWGPDVKWEGPWSIYDQFEVIRTHLVRATGDQMTIYLRAGNRYPFKHNDFYIDRFDVQVERAGYDCDPREGFAVKRALVLPTKGPDGQQISREMWEAGGRWAYAHDLMDVGNSPDSLCHAPGVASVGYYLGQIAPGYPDPDDYRQFNQDHYPKCRLLGTVQLYDDSPEPPDPPEPGDGQVPPNQRRPVQAHDLTLGFHTHAWHGDRDTFIKRMHSDHLPGVVKSLSAGQLAELSRELSERKQDQVLRVLRHVVNSDHAWLAGDLREKARSWLDIYSAKLEDAVEGLPGVGSVRTLLTLLNYPVLESINEVVGTYTASTDRAVEFDCHLMEACEARYGRYARIGFGTIAIGNPAMDELDRLLPAVRMACEARPKHVWAHHQAYWGTRAYRESYHETVPGAERVPPALVNPPWYWFLTDDGVWSHRQGTPPDPETVPDLEMTYSDGLERHWPWLAGRSQVWWDYFSTRHGLFFEHYAGEGGALTTPGDCGPAVLGGRGGWREAGSWDYVEPQLRHFNARWRRWNETHGNLFYGMAYFTHKWWGWSTHWVLGGEHREWMQVFD